MNRITQIAGIAAITLVAAIAAPRAQAAQTIRCESQNGRYQTCSVNTQGGVRLSRQLSSQGCWQNDTWGYDRNRVWVTNGCRAEFAVGDSHSSSGSSSKDNSGAVAGAVALGLIGAAIIASHNNDNRDRDRYDNNDRYDNTGYNGNGNGGYNGNGYNPSSTVRCESDNGRYRRCNIRGRGQVEVYRQISSTPCRYGSSWGVEGNSIWVNNGCRAEFAVY